jgi:hypothetical protein
MKLMLKRTSLLCIYFLVVCITSYSQNATVNKSGNPANASSFLDIDAAGLSPKKGLLIPRVTFAERGLMNTLPAAAQGLVVYQTDNTQGFYYNTSTTTTPAWTF